MAFGKLFLAFCHLKLSFCHLKLSLHHLAMEGGEGKERDRRGNEGKGKGGMERREKM